jgi:zinc protease
MNTIKNIAVRARSVRSKCLFGLLLGLAGGFLNAHAALPVQHWTHANGARVYLVESPAIPMVDVRVDLDAGARRDPAGKSGLASATAALMTQGVAASNAPGGGPAMDALDENALGEVWADLGASFGASASADRMGFSLRSLTYPDLLPKAVALAARVIAEPSFPEDVWQRNRERSIAAIKEGKTRPATVAGRAFASAVYGAHPYGNDVTEESLQRITPADMKALHASAVAPCRAVVSIVGAVTRAQADALVGQLLGRVKPLQSMSALKADCSPWVPVAEVAPLAAAREEKIPFDSAQAHVLIGQPGYKRDDPDFFALTVGNYILGGGGFVSRLTSEVREKRGLSYSVYSYFSPALHAGAFTLGLQTRPDQASQAIAVSREVLARFVAEGPTEAELDAAKGNLIGGFALLIDTNGKLLDNIANIGWNKLPLDYLDTWTQQIGKVTTADIKAAFARKLQPERMVTVVVGGA